MTAPEAWVHGGAWDIPIEERPAHAEGCRKAAEAAGHVLSAGGSALEAVVAAVEVLEADGTFDAGDGSVLTSEGTIETDAGVMDGASLRLGAGRGGARVSAPRADRPSIAR
jgi:beta-aspartyl-peptidase (threonine type)